MALNHLQIITLQQVKGCGDKSTFTIANYIADNNIIIETKEALLKIINQLKGNKILKRFPDIDIDDLEAAEIVAKRIIQRSDSYGIGIVSYYDEDYPGTLRHTIDETGKPSAPILLYYKGDIKIASKLGVAIIGTREPTHDGEVAGEFISAEFAKRGINIVSGLAIGCDTSGHIGALNVDGITTAFLAHGLDSIYPQQNEELANQILSKGGLLLSEYPVGTGVNRYNLVARDRLQAALASATIVIQTGIKGGTMHAANTTLAARKPLYCVWYKNEKTRLNDKVLGNELLVNKGAAYLRADSNFDDIINMIKTPRQVYKGLFT